MPELLGQNITKIQLNKTICIYFFLIKNSNVWKKLGTCAICAGTLLVLGAKLFFQVLLTRLKFNLKTMNNSVTS
jgi:hypothetical protein